MARVIAVPLLIAFLGLLVFAYAVTSRRRERARKEIEALHGLVDKIRTLAATNEDIDPSARLINMAISDFERELKQ